MPKQDGTICPECHSYPCNDQVEHRGSNSASVTGYVPSLGEIKSYSAIQAKGFIVGSLTVKFNLLDVPPEKACEMANLIIDKAQGK